MDELRPLGLPDDGRGTVVTVGTFDGVHRGHRAVLDEIVRRARGSNRRSVLVTFEPHPLRIVRPEAAPPLLTSAAEKKEALAATGLDCVVFLSFTPELARLGPVEFVEDVLLQRIGVQELVIGYDHGFGRDRSGGVDLLRVAGERHGFAVDVVGPVAAGGEAISSSRIRRALEAGDLEGAAEGLGRPPSLRGRVERGAGRGRTLNFPTANLALDDPHKLLPPPGVYGVRVWTRKGGAMGVRGALHLGPRPTFPGAPPSVEVHLLDWEADLYGEFLRVDLLHPVRPIRPFPSVEELVAQIRQDVESVRSWRGIGEA
jgi:riboflavin kinase / FMN adenylyltransferase